MRPDILVPIHEQTDIASARREALHAASLAGFNEEDAGGLALIVTEAASNQVKHGGGGDLILRDLSSGVRAAIEVIALDSGKGMNDIARCFADGFTTAGSPGNGLGAIVRLSSFHDVYSQAGKGTVLLAQVGTSGDPHENRYELGAISIPYPGETVCGDSWEAQIRPDLIRVIVADGLGHGVFAAEASAASLSYMDRDRNQEPVDVVENAHRRLKSTRGAAIGVLDIDQRARTATFAGVGNIAASILDGDGPRKDGDGPRQHMTSMNGTLGHEMRGARQYQYALPANALVVLHSDGLATHWSFDKYPGLIGRHPGVIAGVLFRDFRRIRDDATVVVLRLRS